jgi:UDP-glucose 4-epimerase
MNILVTGGAGYIGSHAVQRLVRDGHHVAVVDNLYRGHRAAVPAEAAFYEADLRDTQTMRDVLRRERIEGVLHFAALAYVGESVHDPLGYYDNNSAGSLSLLRAMEAEEVERLVFSSTCATYGEPEALPIHEGLPQHPINPYGRSKLVVEYVLKDYAAARPGFAFAALRYFNVAGCALDGSIGEDHTPESHLIPLVLLAALGRRPALTIFGDDYDTPDGTCIRDYIHVVDLVDAHVAVLNALQPGDQRFYNLGIGKGISVREIIDAARRVTGREIPVQVGPRRAGDPAVLYADAGKIARELGWRAQLTDLDAIIETAWRWFQAHPDGYGDA